MIQASHSVVRQRGTDYDTEPQELFQVNESSTLSDARLVASPISLPNGRILPNRLVKVAMYEHLASFGGGLPNQYHLSLYSRWAEGGWGMIITGNCQISSSHLSLGRDIIFPSSESARNSDAFRALSTAMRPSGSSDIQNGTAAIIQLNHCGRQSPRFIGGRLGSFRHPLSPSFQRVGHDTKEGFFAKVAYKLMFQTPKVIRGEDISGVVKGFVSAAKLACETGFDGVQLHAAHGYLISQFLSPKLNTLKNDYSKPLLLIQEIITRIRAVTPTRFILGIKLNAGDYVSGDLSEEDALEHVRQIALLGVDFIEISGGDYENPAFMAPTSPRQAFFSSFSRRVVQNLPRSEKKAAPLILLTGSLRTPSQFSEVIRQKHAHLVGLGRLSVLCPDLPLRISPTSLSRNYGAVMFPLPEPTLNAPLWFPKLIGAGIGTAWYIVGMRQVASGTELDTHLGSLDAVFWMWAWIGPDDLKSIVTLILVVIFALVFVKLVS